MSPKFIFSVAAISLAVVLAHQHVAAGGGIPKPKIGN
jgi:hypothetical protein